MKTIAEKLIEQGYKEGYKEGFKIGYQEGLRKGKMELVSKAMENLIQIEIISMLSELSPEEIRQYHALTKMKPATMN